MLSFSSSKNISKSRLLSFSKAMKKWLSVFLLLVFAISAKAQQQATVMCYNVLNFPTGNIEGREDTLRNIVNYVQPDLFLIQELKNDSGLQLILNESFADLSANYAASTFVPQQSNGSSDFKLQQALIYNSDLFGLADEGVLQTQVRDLNKFRLYYKNPNLENGADTAFFYVFVVHFKSSQGNANVQARLSMVQTLTFHQQYLPSNASMIVAGDFNMYTSEEPGYQELLDPSNRIKLVDPIDTPGNWTSSSFQPKSVLTQSTRSSSIFGDGAGGGIDDRFDFVLLSDDMFQPWNTIVYEPDSYYAMGNTGDCYNQSITDCSGGEWPDDILQSLYYMSDHLPVVLKLNLGVGSVSANSIAQQPQLQLKNQMLEANWPTNESVLVSVKDVLGRNLFQQKIEFSSGLNQYHLPIDLFASGVLLFQVQSAKHQATLKTFSQ